MTEIIRRAAILFFGLACIQLISYKAQAQASDNESQHENSLKSGETESSEKKQTVQKNDQQLKLERLKKELEDLKSAEAMKAVSDIDVELIQYALNALGFQAGEVNNEIGPATRAAIRRFQYSTIAYDNSMSDAEKNSIVTGVLTPSQTIELFKIAANANHPMSQYVYGIMYVRGIGVKQDGLKAVSWLEKAADQDFAIANYVLCVIYRDGTVGHNKVWPDEKKYNMYLKKVSVLAKSCSDGDGLFGVDFPIVDHPDKTNL